MRCHSCSGFIVAPRTLSSYARLSYHPVSFALLRPHSSQTGQSRPVSTASFRGAPVQRPISPFVAQQTPSSSLQASVSLLGLLAVATSVAIGTALYYRTSPIDPGTASDQNHQNLEDLFHQMTSPTQAGRVGNLTAEQEEKLRQLWVAVSRVCGIALIAEADASADDEEDGLAAEPSEETQEASNNTAAQDASDKKKDKKKKRNLFKRSKKDDASSAAATGAADATATLSATKSAGSIDAAATAAAIADDDKYGQGKQFQEALASQSAESIRATIWSMVKHDHPDALMLRFLRARKWDVDKALVMLVSTMHWRAQEMHVDDDIIKTGEGGAAELAKSTDESKDRTVARDFLAQMRMGKSFLHGTDKEGRPICLVRVRLHHQGDQVEESVERTTVFTIETARMALQPPVDTATVIFDMTGFSLANMDYSPVKFMIKCFEANYPESLGAVLVHKAPWLFQGIWRIIRGWLDPVVASKVHFTNNAKDLEQFISKDKIIKELDGDEDWEYTYLEPEPGENDKMKDTATRDKLLAEREALYNEFEAATAQWVLQAKSGEQLTALKAKRNEIAERLREDYWRLDPYIRARTLYDRIGMLQTGGKVDFYPQIKKDELTQTNGNAEAQATDGDAA